MTSDQIVRVRFSDVGPSKQTWEADIPLTFSALVKQIRKHHALGSRDLLFDLDAKAIYAGVRKVGRVEVLDGPLESIT
jgi:hypothetical protein